LLAANDRTTWQRLAQRYWNTVREAQIAAMAQAHQR
jgi:hypothetical protein